MEMEFEEDMVSNMYNTLHQSAVDVMDTAEEDNFNSEWEDRNEFFYFLDEKEPTPEVFETRVKKYLSERESWESSKDGSLIIVSKYDIHNIGFEKIKPNAIVLVSTKYSGDEKDLSEFHNSNIFYYGTNVTRFIRFFGKYGMGVKL